MSEQNYMIHRPGGGKLYDFAQSTEGCTIDKESQIHGYAEIYNSTLINCVVKGEPIIANAHLENCYVEGSVRITGGRATGCEFYDFSTMAENATALNSCFHGRSRLFGGASVTLAALRDASVHGRARIVGIEGHAIALDGLYRVGLGDWTEAPRFRALDEGLVVALTESTDGYAYIGCERKKMTEWIRQGDRLGKKFGWRQETVDRAKEIFREWQSETN